MSTTPHDGVACAYDGLAQRAEAFRALEGLASRINAMQRRLDDLNTEMAYLQVRALALTEQMFVLAEGDAEFSAPAAVAPTA